MKNILELAETEEERDYILDLLDELHSLTAGSIKQLEYEKKVLDGQISVTKKDIKEYSNKNEKLNKQIYKLFEMMHGLVDYSSYIILKDKIKDRIDFENDKNEESGKNEDKIEFYTDIQHRLESFKHHFFQRSEDETEVPPASSEKRKRGRPRKNP